jgi:hypothetical protein
MYFYLSFKNILKVKKKVKELHIRTRTLWLEKIAPDFI